MARGWESKDVEAQVETAGAKQPRGNPASRSPEELQRNKEREGLELTRKRILNDLEAAVNPRHRAMLEAALKHLDGKIAALK